MKKIVFLTLFFFFNIFLNAKSFAINNISFIDVDYIYSNSEVGKKINSDLSSKLDKINKEFSNYKKIIETEKDKINNQRNIISEEEFKKKTIELDKKVKNFNSEISKKRNQFETFKKDTYNSFLKELMNIIKEYADKNSIDLILKKENIIIGKNNSDISDNILELLNNKIKSIN